MIEGCDLFIGVSGPGLIEAKSLEKMNKDAMVFAMANPTPEVMPEEAEPYVRIMATGRSDYPNQINNVLCFPGVFRGALDAGAPRITEAMKLAAARGIAEVVSEDDLSEDYVIPSVFNRDVAPTVARAVVEEAKAEGLARISEETGTFQIVVETRRGACEYQSPARAVRVLVTGATGSIGSALCDALLARGDEVVGLTRDPAKAKPSNPTVTWHAWQATTERPPPEAFAEVDAVVNLIGEEINQRLTDEAKARIRESRVTAAHNLIQAISALETPAGDLRRPVRDRLLRRPRRQDARRGVPARRGLRRRAPGRVGGRAARGRGRRRDAS